MLAFPIKSHSIPRIPKNPQSGEGDLCHSNLGRLVLGGDDAWLSAAAQPLCGFASDLIGINGDLIGINGD